MINNRYMKIKLSLSVMLLMLSGLCFKVLPQVTLLADGFWQCSGVRTHGTSITDANNVVYRFRTTAASNGSNPITINLTAPGPTSGLCCLEAVVQLYDNSNNYLFEAFGMNTNGIYTATLTLNAFTTGTTYRIVATTTDIGRMGTFRLDVSGPVAAASTTPSFAKPLTFLHAGGFSTGNTSVELDRFVSISANAELCPSTSTLSVVWEFQQTGTTTFVDLKSYYPLPYYFIMDNNTAGTYRARITLDNGTPARSTNVTLTSIANNLLPNTWSQSEFIVGCWMDPLRTGVVADDDARMQVWRNAGFTLLFCNGNWSANNTPAYVIDRTIAANQQNPSNPLAHCLIADNAITGGNNCNPSRAFSRISAGISATLNTYLALAPERRNAMTGYFIWDEPVPTHHANTLSTLELAASTDRTKVAFVNMGEFTAADAAAWWDNFYTPVVQTYIRNPLVKVITYDVYPFLVEGVRGNNNGYHDDRYFWRRNLYATTIKNGGYKVNEWGISNCSGWIAGPVWHIPLPAEPMLRFNAFGAITFGAKGIVWYIYNGPDTPATTDFPGATNGGDVNSNVYPNLSKVNNEVIRMGPTLMKLKWKGTVHGSSTNPPSGETGLPTTNVAPLYSITKGSSASSSWKKDSICIGVHTDGTDDYLMVFNKSIHPTTPGSFNYTGYVNKSIITTDGSTGLKYPLQFNKTTGIWESLLRVRYDGTTKRIGFDVHITPGDMNLIRLAPGNVVPIVDLSLTQIGTSSGIQCEPRTEDASALELTGNSFLGSTSDNIIFANKSHNAGCMINTRLYSQVSGCRSGIMIRSSLAANSPFIFLCRYYDNNMACVYYRTNQGGTVSSTPATYPTIALPFYMRVIRSGKTVRAQISPDGKVFTEIAKLAFPGGTCYAGLCTEGKSISNALFLSYSARSFDPETGISSLLMSK